MAKAYRALSIIRHGVANDEGVETEVKVFPYGSIVSGLDTDTMKNLWDAGVLEELEIPDAQTTQTGSSPSSEGQGEPAAGSKGSDAETGADKTS
jgi:hypothetical protein